MNKRLAKAAADHEKWLRQHNCHLDQIKKRGLTKRKKLSNNYKLEAPAKQLNSLVSLGPTGLKKEENKYTGTKLIGITIVHKSGLQPVFSKEQAVDAASMRR